MAGEVQPVGEAKTGLIQTLIAYGRSVVAEMHKVTWPEWPQVRQATIGIIVFVLVLGVLISAMDGVLYGVLQRLLPSLFGGGGGR